MITIQVDRQKQAAAIRLYQQLGFEFIDRSNDNQIAQVFMEKQLCHGSVI
ncbi:hypothetical protein IQ266_06400 [filamentous cyanobacterium LEGE 11480]|uniref:Acetyltransferase n=1 Tax=Romeriopsis navalis LEGE 11480 TaxID=2777977 RepID=A0A928VKG8_9CYAN|nr:hypothetical protein [Romeriopsis navalis]MBE9029393.1 hypothetical protein [Romeriopsis navalis LEGE 11480]